MSGYVKNGTPVGGTVAAADITDATATGISLVTAANAAAARTALGTLSGLDAARPAASTAGRTYDATDTGARYLDTGSAWIVSSAGGGPDVAYTSAYGLDTSTGWTLVQGNGTAAIGSGLATLSTASGVNTQTPNRPAACRALARPATRGCDVAARLASFTGTIGNPRALLNLSNLADGANGTYGATDYGISALAYPNGIVELGDIVGGAAFASRHVTAAAALPIDGTGWVRVVVTPLGYTLLTGVGATYATAVWTVRHTQSITAAVAPVATLALSGYRNGTDAEAFAAVWASPVAMVL